MQHNLLISPASETPQLVERCLRCPSPLFLSFCKGFGYVTFKDKEGLLRALEMTQLTLNNRNLRVEVAKPQNRRGAQVLCLCSMYA